jgi:putative surface cell wall-binding protein
MRRRRIAKPIVLLTTAVLSLSPSLATAGSLSVTGGAPGVLGGVTLNGHTQNAYATLGTYQASDTTLTGAGWNITFQASQFSCAAGTGSCPATSAQLPLSSLVMAPPTVACASGTSCTSTQAPPTISIQANTAIDTAGSAGVKVASAAANTGEGTYDFTPALVDGTSGHNLRLTVPSSAYATTYTSTLTISIVSGP